MFTSRGWNDVFDPAVELHLGKFGEIRHVTSAHQAAAILLDEWPETAGPAYVLACRTCLAAATGRLNAANARLNLIEAARESGILANFPPPDRPSAPKVVATD